MVAGAALPVLHPHHPPRRPGRRVQEHVVNVGVEPESCGHVYCSGVTCHIIATCIVQVSPARGGAARPVHAGPAVHEAERLHPLGHGGPGRLPAALPPHPRDLLPAGLRVVLPREAVEVPGPHLASEMSMFLSPSDL